MTDEPHILFANTQMEQMARTICERDPRITLGDISWKRFTDRFPNTFIRGVDDLRKAHVSFLACFNRPEVIFEQLSVIYTLATLRPRSFRILLPYFPTGTMERVDEEGQVATAATLAQMLSNVAPAGPGPVRLFIWDIHALSIRSFFGQNIAPRFKTGTKLVLERLKNTPMKIAFPDDGARKRFGGMITAILKERASSPDQPIVCRKLRAGSERIVSVLDGNPEGSEVVIIDDLMHSGVTTIECMKALKDAGATKVSAYATHGVLEEDAWKRFEHAGFDKVWITDSCPETVQLVQNVHPFEVLSLAQSITNAILE